MSAILSRNDAYSPAYPICSFCGDTCCPPFVHWHAQDDLFICSDCCRSLRRGLLADMIHVTAVSDLHNAGYHSQTLVRKGQQEIDATAKSVADHLRIIKRT
jgi:hypothetical protein